MYSNICFKGAYALLITDFASRWFLYSFVFLKKVQTTCLRPRNKFIHVKKVIVTQGSLFSAKYLMFCSFNCLEFSFNNEVKFNKHNFLHNLNLFKLTPPLFTYVFFLFEKSVRLRKRKYSKVSHLFSVPFSCLTRMLNIFMQF